jgi:hypothetical protein
MTYTRSWKSLRLTLHTWLGLNPQIGRPLSRIVVPLVYFFYLKPARINVLQKGLKEIKSTAFNRIQLST